MKSVEETATEGKNGASSRRWIVLILPINKWCSIMEESDFVLPAVPFPLSDHTILNEQCRPVGAVT
jgi:hypothetical protein